LLIALSMIGASLAGAEVLIDRAKWSTLVMFVAFSTGALHVTVVPYDDYRVPATWEVASFNPGSSEREHCELALCKIVCRLRQRFDVSP